MNHWNTLGIKRTSDKKQIKRAYAKLLKTHKPEQDPDGYQRLREAFDSAMQYSKHHASSEEHAFSVDLSLSATDVPAKEAPPAETDLHENITASKADIERDEAEKQRTKEERQAFKQALKLKAEQQHIEEQKTQEIAEKISTLCSKLFSFNNEVDGINFFQKAISSDLLLNIKNRQLFESLCFHQGTEWGKKKSFPAQLFEYISAEFDWSEKKLKDDCFLEKIDFLNLKITAGLEYQTLLKLSKKKRFFVTRSEKLKKIEAARLVLGKYRAIGFNFHAFFVGTPEGVKEILHRFTEVYTPKICPQINTPSFRWWLKRETDHQYSLAHALFALLLAHLLILLTFKKFNIHLEGPYLFLVYLFASGLLSVIVWRFFRFMIYIWKEKVPIVTRTWSRFVANPSIFSGLTVLYLLLFLLSAYMDTPFYSFLYFVLAALVAIALLKSSAIFVCITSFAYAITRPVMGEIQLPQIFDSLYAYISILSVYIFIWLARKLPAKYMNIVMDNLLLLFISLFCISILLTYTSLTILKNIFP